MLKRPFFLGSALALCAALLWLGGAAPSQAETKLDSDGDKAAYGVGFAVGKGVQEQLTGFGLSKEEMTIAISAINDALADTEPKTDIDAALKLFQAKLEATQQAAFAQKIAENGKFLDEAAGAKGAEKLESGLVFTSLTAGGGAAPKATDSVKVHYVGTLTTGETFDSSRARGEPAVFPLNGVIPCFSQGILKMKVGGKAKLVCPHDIAYGERGSPPAIPPFSVLVFEIELLGIE